VEPLREKIGQLIMVGCRGETIGAEEQLIFEEYGFGGFILFRRNCAEPGQILALCRGLWKGAADTPPFIAIDQEGGAVHRLPEAFTHFPAAATLGARGDPDLAYRAGYAAGTELSLIGINLNFAPVLDVDSNPANPIIGARAFGSDPGLVRDLALAWARGLRASGILPCGKHFPGHGGTDSDSHLSLPVLEKSLADLESVELPPFAAACRSGIEALMTAHVSFPALDPKHPATLSESIVTGLLRHQLGYDGVVFSDDLEMRAISDRHSAGEAAILALLAGVDVALFCHDAANGAQALEALDAEAGRSPALRARVETSHRRVTTLKQRGLKSFSGAAADELQARLARFDHRRIAAAIHGSL
jgi:beta-N-acetylhexosaminidase